MNKIRKCLSQGYPQEENRWRIIITISLFIELFILIFQPFGLNNLNTPNKALLLAGYGVVTFIILVFNLLLLQYLLPEVFRDEKWTVIKEIIFLIWILFTVGLGNLLYSSLTMGFRLTWPNVMSFQAFTIAIGIIPIMVITLLKQNYLQRKNEANARMISGTLSAKKAGQKGEHQVQISSENEKEGLALYAEDILFVKAEGNYITVGYIKNGKPSKELLRNTMKYATDQLAFFPFIFQCHRSWMVNLQKISKVSGNSQGLRIVVEGFEEEIPVARKNAAGFRQRIESSGE